MNEISVTKKMVEQYSLRQLAGWWAIITVDEGKGLLSIQSDYGDYAYYWSSPGMPFKKFLLSIDDGYLMNKLSGGVSEFLLKETVEAIKKDISESELSKSEQEDFLSVLDAVEGNTINEFCYSLTGHSELINIIYSGDYLSVPIRTDIPYQCQAFVKKIWPEFKKVLKQEVEDKVQA